MKKIYNSIFLNHDTGYHPENKSRLTVLGEMEETPLNYDESILANVHSPEYIERVKEQAKKGIALDGDTLLSEESFKVAVYAANAAVLASESNGFALSRPPGHHAYRSRGSGFCIFNNIAIASQKLVDEGKKVLILDFDGHFGDGTSDIFYSTDRVLYISIHQYPAFPGNNGLELIGDKEGKGYNINIPIPAGSGDDIFMNAVESVVIPIALQYNPDVVSVSAGFDAHFSDPLLDLRFSTGSFYKAGGVLSENFSNVFAILEGGYNTGSLPHCINSFIAGINGTPLEPFDHHTDSQMSVWDEYQIHLSTLVQQLKKYWKV